MYLAAKVYRVDKPIIMRSGVRLFGQGPYATQLQATNSLTGPVLTSESAQSLAGRGVWFEEDGMIVRFSVDGLCIRGENATKTSDFVLDAEWLCMAKPSRLQTFK